MAAFSSNIDITSGGTYAMDVTNGETSSKVATDLNGKFANIQELLQNGLPEVWTGSSLPDSLPNGKLINYNNLLYYGNSSNHLIQLALQSNVDNISSIVNNKSQIIVKSDVKNSFQPTSGILYTIDTSHQFFILMGYVISTQINDGGSLYWSNGSSSDSSLIIGRYSASNSDSPSPFVIIYSNNMVVSVTDPDLNGFINTYSNPCIYLRGNQTYNYRFDYYSFT